jgi:macrolide transport system ATP-binding/permease protein
MFVVEDAVFIAGVRRILDGLSMKARPGERVGVIGENGVGKSTLLRLLARVAAPHGGRVAAPTDLGFLAQELPFDPAQTVGDVIDDALAPVKEALRLLDESAHKMAASPPGTREFTAAENEYADRLERAQSSDAWDAEHRAAAVLDVLGLGAMSCEQKLVELSGGERARLALAALLVRRPSALVLDEPTNHLDETAIRFLEDQLRAFTGVIVLSSHDRAFLDAVCTSLVDLDARAEGPVTFGGTYTAYIEYKRAERRRWEQRYRDEQEEIRRIVETVDAGARAVAVDRAPRDSEKMGYGHRAGRVQSQVARRVRDARRRLDEAIAAQVTEPPPLLRLEAPAAAVAADVGPIVELIDVTVPGRLRLRHLRVDATEKILVIGPNGAGKSTLLGVMAGEVPHAGDVVRRAGLTVSLLPQHSRFTELGRSVADTYRDAVGHATAERRPLVGLGLLGAREINGTVGDLSIGQRRRLALAQIFARPPHLLLLDEPSNHLSPTLLDDLEAAFSHAPGAVVIASHDRRLRDTWTGPLLSLAPPVADRHQGQGRNPRKQISTTRSRRPSSG